MMNILDYIPQNGYCSRLFIVGPYPMDTYIRRLQKELAAIQKEQCEIVVYVDESWNEDILESIRQLPNTKVILVKALKSNGLVHAKMYFLECKNAKGKMSSTLITGSGNASNNGMDNNAEVMTVAKLAQFSKDSQIAIKKYFRSFVEREECLCVEEVKATFKKQIGKSSVIMPCLIKSNKFKSFYSGLRSGVLFYRYEKDQNFGYIVVNLEQPLPINKKISGYIKKSIFDSGKDLLQTLRYKYLDNLEENEDVKNIAPTRYALESAFGYWISRDCFNDMSSEIFPNKILSDLKECVWIKKQKKQKIIKNRVTKALKGLSKYKVLRECIGTKIDEVEKLVESKIERDFRMASDEHFVFRYKTGFDYHKMPNFDESDFEDFINTIFASCLIKQKGNSVSNLFAQKIRCILKEENRSFDDADKLAKWLNDNWCRLYPKIRFYYKNEIEFVSQKYKTDSGIACVAMLVHKKYGSMIKKAKDILPSTWGKKDNYELDNAKIKKLLNALKDNSSYRFKPFKSWETLKGRNLLCVKSDGFEKKGHWIIAERIDGDIVIYDPARNSLLTGSQKEFYKKNQNYISVSY